jgi:UDP-N-acetylmuramate-alanine ligase
VAGSHGKTTTSMIAAVTPAGLDPTIVVGGRVGSSARTRAWDGEI